MPTETYPDLSDEEQRALLDFAADHGKGWKPVLRDQWIRATASPVLQRLRDTHGPIWLETLRISSRDALEAATIRKKKSA